MKKLLYILLALPLAVFGQSNLNYVLTHTYKDSTETSDASKAHTSITYFDAIGRPIQQIAGKMSGDGKDIITHIAYDSFGRQPKQYLPYASQSTSLEFDTAAKTNTALFYGDVYYESTQNPYSQSKFESSPLNRVLKQAAPGNPWQMDTISNNDKAVKFAYLTNAASEVKFLSASSAWDSSSGLFNPSFIDYGYYIANELYKTETTDENGVTTEEFKNMQGQVVLKRAYESNVKHDTYYVYDQHGNLSYVLPPLAEGQLNEGLCFYYKYDRRNRLAEKKIPGRQWEYIVYDNRDLVVATGPALSPFGEPGVQGWIYNYYDIQGRPAITCWYSAGTLTGPERALLQDEYNNYHTYLSRGYGVIDDIWVGYNFLRSEPPGNYKLLTVNYYDDYKWVGAPEISESGIIIEGQRGMRNPIGLLTGTWERMLTDPNGNRTKISSTFYDMRARAIRQYIKQYNSITMFIDTKLNFNGTPQYSITTHYRGSTPIITRQDFTYTPEDRLLTTTHQINDMPAELLNYNTYDKLGQLKSKKVGGTDITAGTALQNIDYSYKIRGWLKGINDITNLKDQGNENDLFAFRINYNEPLANDMNGTVKKLYNGNIAETYWRTLNDDIERSYSYQYDQLNRLLNARYVNAAVASDNYNESMQYDKNGNIKALQRNGDTDGAVQPIMIDDLTYTYDNIDGNRLMTVSDGTNNPSGFKDGDHNGEDYKYDDYGNMIIDWNKGIEFITHNHLNLPVSIDFSGGAKINYLYTATGEKVSKIVLKPARGEGLSQRLQTDYYSGYQYYNGKLQMLPTAEGYVDVTDIGSITSFNYVYQYKDHLGNVRLNYTFDKDNNAIVVLSESNYYPFGLRHKGYNETELQYRNNGGDLGIKPRPTPEEEMGGLTKMPDNYKYQEQERQEELGLNWDSFKWRNYDYAIGRFMSIDPLAEKYAYQSPYNFSENRVIDARELEGLEAEILFNKTKGTLLITPDKSKWKPNLPVKVVSAEKYNPNDKKHNQQILIKNVFTGGKSTNGVVERDPNSSKQKPIPNGTYDILDNDADTRHTGWFRLDKQDSEPYNDKDDATGRDGFRFHTGTVSHGCVTCDASKDDRTEEWGVVSKILENTTTETVPEQRGRQGWNPFSWLTKFGTLTVIGEDKIPTKKDNDD